jgi:hypothetical protein
LCILKLKGTHLLGRPRSGAPESRFAGSDDKQVGPKALHVSYDPVLYPSADGHHDHHGGNTNNHAKNRKPVPKAVTIQGTKSFACYSNCAAFFHSR